MTLIIGWQVFARYVLNDSPAWSEPVALLLMLYYILLTAAVGVYEGFHLGLKVVIDNVSARVRRVLTIINYCLVGFFGLLMLIAQLAEYAFGYVTTRDIPAAAWPAGRFTDSCVLHRTDSLSLSHKEGKYNGTLDPIRYVICFAVDGRSRRLFPQPRFPCDHVVSGYTTHCCISTYGGRHEHLCLDSDYFVTPVS